MLTCDARCNHRGCPEKDIYRMVGTCGNCGTEGVLMLFTEGHETYQQQCPTCGCRSVSALRLATEEEIPVG
jgi:hypothetical protein